MAYRLHDTPDPFAKVLAPPADESPEQAQARVRAERRAAERSKTIDAELESAGKRMTEQKSGVLKMLLLGQSGSGKTTVLKNIRMMEALTQWNDERPLWRAVILRNLLSAVNVVAQALQDAIQDPDEEVERLPVIPISFHGYSKPRTSDDYESNHANGSTTSLIPPAPQTLIDDLEEILYGSRQTDAEEPKEFRVRSQEQWMLNVRADRNYSKYMSVLNVVSQLRMEIKELWNDAVVRAVLKRRRVALDSCEEYFLDHSDRIVSRAFMPTDNDILQARLPTIGIQEYCIKFSNPAVRAALGLDRWWIYDIGGTKKHRAKWAQYFDDVHVILFLAPVHNFDEPAGESKPPSRPMSPQQRPTRQDSAEPGRPKSSGMKDMFELWQSICKNKLLRRATMILFLNKIDLLEKKIAAGKDPRAHISGHYNSRDADSYLTWLDKQFRAAMRIADQAETKRTCYVYRTSAVDSARTKVVLASIQTVVLEQSLRSVQLV
ncbi:G-alpha-domain-containing protein [Phanerochaete sordida]|uniref:G-alpha-domain-containing protein n=1 Tax=Phanerochaete sordida TaxID=48140 RepID=A0A9P3G1U6_9APHY|nr:G-alpha-domain-containing protein [Phanerochaete sordida]